MFNNVKAVIPTRNRVDSVKRLISELNDQKIKTIVVDNGDDNLCLDSESVCIYRVPPSNLSNIFNACIDAVDTEFALFCADDIYEVNGISDAVKYLCDNEDVAVVTGPIYSFDQDASKIKNTFERIRQISERLFSFFECIVFDGNMYAIGNYCSSGFYTIGAGLRNVNENSPDVQNIDLATSSWALIRCSAVADIGGFSKKYYFNHVDGDLFLRLRQMGWKIAYLKKFSCVHLVLKSESRNPYYIGYDTATFLKTDYKINGKRSSKFNRTVFLILFPFFFVISMFYDFGNYKGVVGYIKGLLGIRA